MWKRLFLEFAGYGVLTSRNPYGPIQGRFGLGEAPESTNSQLLVQRVRSELVARSEAEGWPLDDAPGFKVAILAKRETGDHFDLWWRGAMQEQDVEAMRQRIDCRDPTPLAREPARVGNKRSTESPYGLQKKAATLTKSRSKSERGD